MNLKYRRDLPAESIDPFTPFFSNFSILSDHFSDAPLPKTNDALASSDTRLAIEDKRCSIVVLCLAHGRNPITWEVKQKMNPGNGWCNINNADIPRLWAERWKK